MIEITDVREATPEEIAKIEAMLSMKEEKENEDE